MVIIMKALSYNEWLNSVEGKQAASGVYLILSSMRPSKFEIDRLLRQAYNEYKINVKEGTSIG
jgi:hypothetical protein